MQNEKTVINGGFNYALYLKSPNIRMKDQEARNLKAGLDITNMSLDEKQYKQSELGSCLTDDLLNKIEVGSPMKSINNDNSNILHLNLEECELEGKDEVGLSPSGKLQRKYVEENNVSNLSCDTSPTNFHFSKNISTKNFIEKKPSNSVISQASLNEKNFTQTDFQNSQIFNLESVQKFNNFEEDFKLNEENHQYRDYYFKQNYNSSARNHMQPQGNMQNFNNNYDGNRHNNRNMNMINREKNVYGSIYNSNSNIKSFENQPSFMTNNVKNQNYPYFQNNYNKNILSNKSYQENALNYQVNPSYNNYQKTQNNQNIQQENKRKKQFVEREGDWVCMRCKNKNFSFRVHCNRCRLSKKESEEMYNDHMKNLMNLVQMNEMMQNKIFNQNCPNLVNNVNNQGLPFDPTLFSPNSCPIYDENCSDMYSIGMTYTYKDNQTFPQN